MTDIHLKDFLGDRTQKEVADIMGVTPGAVSQAFIAERDIYFKSNGKGGFTYYEIKKPRQKKAA